ncbi:MAG: M28 family peptidase [Saprospiraceae bacterium]|nr:M28 family peptidase [Candidatus Vicinibacter affinis]
MNVLQKISSLKTGILLIIILGFSNPTWAQTNEEHVFTIKKIYDLALTNQLSYKWLGHLSEKIGGRIAGSPQSLAAIEFTHQVLDTLGTDTVWNQQCTVNYWFRGAPEEVKIINNSLIGTKTLKSLALGGSGASPEIGLSGDLIELKSLDEAKNMGTKLKGKIVYFSRPFDPTQFRTFGAYGGAVDQRVFGPNTVAKLGAKACIIRSMTGRLDDFPHTGVTIWEAGVKPIPAVAISTNDAEFLSKLTQQTQVQLYIKTSCEDRGPKTSYSVIGEIKGSEKPNEIILVGGHLDSWDVGGGAHDDGAGCVHSMEVFHLLKNLNYKPRRTLRCVLFMNEENGLAGGTTYAKVSRVNNEFHFAAIESDAGGFTPLGFSYDGDTSILKNYTGYFSNWNDLLSPYGIEFAKGGSGADIGPLKEQKGILFGLTPDSQRYFDFHHTENDRIQGVHPRELALGSAALTSLVYLLDRIP